ncbi:hypothetical protein BKA66DRAFT_149445 [Pyrenochaeta sp. MPI-SDFR-AT-0127]|nr:hypothetical protein BKA66DRAFT_149445 [Pyrenochaeta sp. MPI-SDFR-AT-0127]
MADPENEPILSALEGVPQYVLDHAPLLHLFSKDRHRPSSIAAQVPNTHPAIDFKTVPVPSPPLTLDNLDQLNSVGANGGRDCYLTSNDDVTKSPKWLEGVQVDANGGTGESKTGVVIVVDKGGGVVDAFYFYFYANNWGGVVLAKELGDHVGDWEHNMIRFNNGVPQSVWLSQHANGAAYTFSSLNKDKSGKRPVLYSANGSHAVYPTAGKHDHTIPNLPLPFPFILVDETDAGPLYDPILSSYYYTYTPPTTSTDPFTGTFTPISPSPPDTPTRFLHFTGRWGDAEYPESDPRQKGKGLFGFKKFVGGPTGPADKQLVRAQVWPQNQWSAGQRIRTGLDGRSWLRDGLGKLACCGGLGRSKAERERNKAMKGVKRINVNGEVVG